MSIPVSPKISSGAYKLGCGLLAVLAVLQAVNLLWVEKAPVRILFSDILQMVASILTALFTLQAARKLRRASDQAAEGWSYIALAMVIWAIGMVIFLVVEDVLMEEHPYPGIADYFFMAFYPLMMRGLYLLPSEKQTRRQFWNNVLDVTALAIVVGMAIWQFNVRLLLESVVTGAKSGSWASFAYSALDYALLLIVFTRLVRKLNQGSQFAPMLLQSLGCLCLIPTDILQGYVATFGNFVSGTPIDMGWVLFSVFAGIAALHVLHRETTPEDEKRDEIVLRRQHGMWAIIMTYFCLGSVLVMLVWSVLYRENFAGWMLYTAVVFASGFAIIRQVRMHKESSDLHFRLETAQENLENKIKQRTEQLERRTAQLQQRTAQLQQQDAQLIASEAFRRQVFDASPVAIVVIDAFSLNFVDCNPAALAICGFTDSSALFGKTPLDVSVSIQYDGRPAAQLLQAHIARTKVQGNAIFEWQFRRPNAALWDAEVNLQPFNVGQRGLLQFTLQDITERKRLEREREILQTQLIQAQKMEAIGTLAGGVAHDFNNILTGIMGNIQLGLMDLDDHVAKPCVEEALKASHRAKDLVAKILTFSRKTETDFRPANLGPVIREVAQLLRSSIPASIEFQVNLDEGCPAVLCDVTQIHQVVMNLGSNSAHAMREKGCTLSIGLKRVQITPETNIRHPQLRREHVVCLSVADDGSGMQPEVLARIFEPFFTTKPQGEGTGLGLSMVHGIVANHNGAIVVDSTLGKGTCFQLYFPAAAEQPVCDPLQAAPRYTKGHGERILLIDDDQLVLDVAANILRKIGYQPKPFRDPVQALAFFEDNSGKIDLLLTDFTMPVLSGHEIIRRVLAIRPDLPVIMATGYTGLGDHNEVAVSGTVRFAKKPYAVEELALLVHEVLHQAVAIR